MSFVKIENTDDDWFNMGEEREILELNPWVVLNLNEIGNSIAHDIFKDYDEFTVITDKTIKNDIDEFLYDIHYRIHEKVVQVLEENGVNVL